MPRGEAKCSVRNIVRTAYNVTYVQCCTRVFCAVSLCVSVPLPVFFVIAFAGALSLSLQQAHAFPFLLRCLNARGGLFHPRSRLLCFLPRCHHVSGLLCLCVSRRNFCMSPWWFMTTCLLAKSRHVLGLLCLCIHFMCDQQNLNALQRLDSGCNTLSI